MLEPDEKYDTSRSGYFNEGMCTEMKFFSFMGWGPDSRYENGAALVRTLPNEEGMVSYGYVDKKGKWLIKKEYNKELDERELYY